MPTGLCIMPTGKSYLLIIFDKLGNNPEKDRSQSQLASFFLNKNNAETLF